MKKTLVFSLLLTLAMTMHAQLSLQVGGNYSFINKQDNIKAKWDPGFQAGLTYDLGRVFVFQPGIYFQQKGFAHVTNLTGIESSYRYNMNYLEVPLNLMVKIPIGIKLIAGVGVTGAIGLFGNVKTKIGDLSDETKIRFDGELPVVGETYAHLQRFDWGGQVFLGVQISRVAIMLTYNNGFCNVETDPSRPEIKNRSLMLNVSYRFSDDPERQR